MPLPKDITDLTTAVETAVVDYASGLDAVQRSMYEKVLALLKDLSTDANGNIRATLSNYKTITKVKNILKNELNSKQYLNNVAKIADNFITVNDIQGSYFETMFADFATPTIIKELQKQALSNTVGSLTESGINEVLVNKATDIVGQNIKSGRNFMDMAGELKDFMVGNAKVDGKLVSYSKQIVNDAISQYAGNYTQLVTEDLGLKWYGFVGALVKDSRPMCRHLVHKKYIHESELPGICRGRVDGGQVSTAGMIPGTDKNNIMVNRIGYNCGHQFLPISAEMVPEDIRKKFEKPTKTETNEDIV
jgi:hypothetical protein